MCSSDLEGVPFCWGDDTYWQLGNYDRVGSLTPLPVDVDSQRTYLQDVLSVAAGESSSCAVKADGSAVCWGASMLGDGTNDPSVLPVEVVQDDLSPLGGVTQVSVGGDVACARTSDGGAWCWGAGSVTGDGTFTERLEIGRAHV